MSYHVSRALPVAVTTAAALLGLASCGDDDETLVRRAHSGVVADLTLEARQPTADLSGERRELAAFRVTNKNRRECPWIVEGPEDPVQTLVLPPGGSDDRSKMIPAVALRKVGPKSFSFPLEFGAGDVTTVRVAASCYEGAEERARVVAYDARGEAKETSDWRLMFGRKDPYFVEFDLIESTKPGGARAGVRLEFEGTGSHAALMSMTLESQPIQARLPQVGAPRSIQRGEGWCSAAGLVEGAPWTVAFDLEGGTDARRRLALTATLPGFVRSLPSGARLEAQLSKTSGEPVAARSFELRGFDGSGWRDVSMEFADVPAGAYELELAVADEDENRAAALLVGDALFVEPTDAPKTVLLITSDTHRGDYLGLARPMPFVDTPSLDALGQRGAYFDAGYSTTNITNPSHIAVMSGIHPRDTQIVDNTTQLTSRVQTLAEIFRANGYRTLAAISTQHLDPGQSGLGQGFGRLDAPSDFKRSGDIAIDRVKDWLDASEGVSTFAWVHVFDAHAPYDPPENLMERRSEGLQRESDTWDLEERFRPKWTRDEGLSSPEYINAMYAAE
ncbi:MAG: sulfatase-like hydrolase/transferase, partial [Planctomycetota bacterium]